MGIFVVAGVCAEVPGDRGGSPEADEGADQVLLPLHRGHTRASGAGEASTRCAPLSTDTHAHVSV